MYKNTERRIDCGGYGGEMCGRGGSGGSITYMVLALVLVWRWLAS